MEPNQDPVYRRRSKVAIWAWCCAALLLIPYYLMLGHAAKDFAYLIFGFVAIAGLVAGVVINKPDRRWSWFLFAFGNLLFLAGDATWFAYDHILHKEPGFPSFADLLYLACYPALIAGLYLMFRARKAREDRGVFFDALLFTLALAAALYVFVIDPVAQDEALSVGAKLVSAAYPTLDVLLLFMAARMWLSDKTHNASFRFLTGGILFLLAADIGYSFLVASGFSDWAHSFDFGWMLYFAAMACSALHPSMTEMAGKSTEGGSGKFSSTRLLGLTVAGLAGPALIIMQFEHGDSTNELVVSIVTGAVILLIMARMGNAVRSVEDAVEKLKEREELKSALQREREAVTRLENLDDMKNSFLQAVSHELRTPLTSIRGFASTVYQRIDDLTQDQIVEIVARINFNAERLEDLLENLLDVDRLSRGIFKPRLVEADIGELVGTVASELELKNPTRLHVSTMPAMAAVDVSKIERITENLCSNARKHTPSTSEIWVSVEELEEVVLITVADSGPGIPDHLKEAIFQPFTQAASESAHSQGLGLGLSLVRQFAELQGGSAWVDDRPGGGAAFKVSLPRSIVLGPAPVPEPSFS